MSNALKNRYTDVAIIFHWLIAFFIIGLLAVGKYMTSLETDDPMRFQLTQWHKSFGLTVLFLSVLRLLWRFTHSPPAEIASIARWQQRAAHVAHILLYVLLFAAPITGWIMSSASPLNVDTVLFNVITIPHLPPFPDLPNKAEIAEAFHEYHELASNLIILLLLAHIGAALKHHFFDKDVTLVRMLPDWTSGAFKAKMLALATLILGSSAGLYLYAGMSNDAAMLAAGDSEVSFVAQVSGGDTPGTFSSSTVTATISTESPADSSIVAVVDTTTMSSRNPQVEGSLPDAEWFDVANHPEARFESTAINAGEEGNLQVDGDLTIKGTTISVSFPMVLSDEEGKQVARGEFTVDRRDFDIGMESQPNDDTVGFNVTIKFRFDIGQEGTNDQSGT